MNVVTNLFAFDGGPFLSFRKWIYILELKCPSVPVTYPCVYTNLDDVD